ncbi:GntR family transcriptional regulator [Variovorax paradoxus]|uniref:Transcriptional regulator, GntR family n=1 Tax=Variovorax paradoxus (strain EPS) TaxID=595537 RepID=E6V1T7_VARPE|nr:GntR family transcriptional regulator [Variovorax paradoxus]ADU36843.1 transcriptional regulator, GntR family [Variovorax paradoxus EPS]
MRPPATDSGSDIAPAAEAGERKLRYEVIRNRLRQAIVDKRIVQGLVLLEGPVADVFGTSRVPVRKAFHLLHEEGLLQKFPGRGYMVAPRGQQVEPQRLAIDEASLGQDAQGATIYIPSESERIYGEFEQSISAAVVFGHFRIDEVRAMKYFNVNRVALREVLSRLVDRGLVEKSAYAAWRAGPLTARAIAQDFEVLLLLAPAALLESGPKLDEPFLLGLRQALRDPEAVGTEELLRIEGQIHGDCLSRHPNTKMLGILRQCQMPLIVNRTFCRMFQQLVSPLLLDEYRRIVAHLCEREFALAAEALAAHLQAARKRTQQQLKVLAVLPEPQFPDYLVRVA